MKIYIKTCSNENCSEGYTEVYLDDKFLFGGDEYHNKISTFINGFKYALDVFKVDISIDSEQTIPCKFSCD